MTPQTITSFATFSRTGKIFASMWFTTPTLRPYFQRISRIPRISGVCFPDGMRTIGNTTRAPGFTKAVSRATQLGPRTPRLIAATAKTARGKRGFHSRSRSSKRDSYAPVAAECTTHRSAITSYGAAASAVPSTPRDARCAVPDLCPPANHHVATAP